MNKLTSIPIIFFLLIIGLLALIGVIAISNKVNIYKNSKTQNSEPMKNFYEELKKIDSEIKDLTWAGELYKFDFFRKVHEKPLEYVETLKIALIDSSINEQQKIIMVLMTQKLPFNYYIDFSETLLQMLEKKYITYEVFKWAIIPGYEWNTYLPDRYRDTKVQAFAAKLLESENVRVEIKEYLRNDILTGNAKKQVQYLRDIRQIK